MSKHIGKPYDLAEFRTSIDSVGGRTFTRVWRGRSDYLQADQFLLSTAGVRSDLSGNGSEATLSVDYTHNPAVGVALEVPIVQHSIRGEETVTEIWEHRDFSPIPVSMRKEIIKAAGNDSPWQFNVDELAEISADSGYSTELTQRILVAFDLILSGVDKPIAINYVVTKTQTASPQFVFGVGLDDDGLVLSSTQLVAVAGPFPFNIPNLDAIPNIDDPLMLMYGWRKRPVEYEVTRGGKAQLTEQWQSGRFSDWLVDTR